MIISPAFAQAATGSSQAFDPAALMPFVLIFVVFYFLLIRPQQKRAKEHKNMIGGVRRNDTVVTAGGLIGKVSKVSDEEVMVEIADGVKVRVAKGTLASVKSKSDPAPDNKAEKKSDKKSDGDSDGDRE